MSSSLVPKYRKKVVRDRPASAAICSTVVLSKPCSAKSRNATSLTSARITARVRARSDVCGVARADEVLDISAMKQAYDTDPMWYAIPDRAKVPGADFVPPNRVCRSQQKCTQL